MHILSERRSDALLSGAEFSFGTKAETLLHLSDRIETAIFCEQLVFEVRDWARGRGATINRIKEFARNRTLAIRSSARGEDGSDATMAGAHKSILSVRPAAICLNRAIEEVLQSYTDLSINDQILVQPMLTDIAMSGVVFSRDISSGAPYYVINYDDSSGLTDTVTSGGDSKLCFIRRGHERALSDERFRRLIKTVRAIERATHHHSLDIEFAFTRCGLLYILQVRRLMTSAASVATLATDLPPVLDDARRDIARAMSPEPGLAGSRTIYGEMADWNPAEIIGKAPSALALSIYREVITDATWAKAREHMGYRAVHKPLLRDFGGRPYIDIRCSLNSFLPAGLPEDFANRLADWQLQRLVEHPEWHDKVEFEVATTCYDFNFAAREQILRDAGFSADEVADFGDRLRMLTRSIIGLGAPTIVAELEPTARLVADNAAAQTLPHREQALHLLSTCVPHGTLPFSILARHGFVAVTLLRSLVGRGVLSPEQAEDFQRSTRTITTQFVEDVQRWKEGSLPQAELLRRYGHLRPGTYDITSPRYDEQPDLYFGQSGPAAPAGRRFELDPATERAVAAVLRQEGYDLSPDALLRYIGAAIAAREEAKFLFTRNVSDALVALGRWGERFGLSSEDLSHLTLEDIRTGGAAEELRSAAAHGRERHLLTWAVRLPTLVASGSDVDAFSVQDTTPTFITQGRVRAPARLLRQNSVADLNGCIVLIENADPGYDWIFSHRVAGLVTKYGGSNSHMAIRCAEFGLPAAIGAGELAFARLERSALIELDCAGAVIRTLDA